MKFVEVDAAQGELPSLLAQVEAGETITITRGGEPVADLVPPARRRPLVFGTAKGLMSYDSETFDDPDPEIIAMFEGD